MSCGFPYIEKNIFSRKQALIVVAVMMPTIVEEDAKFRRFYIIGTFRNKSIF